MKILVVCQYYKPENFQINPICEELVNRGHKVTVLTGLPNYPTGIVPEEYKHGHRDEYINGVHVLRCNEVSRKKGALNLALNYLSFWQSASRKIRKLEKDFDIVLVYQLSPILMALPGIKYAKKYKKPLFLYCCDLWPESMKNYVKSEKNPLFKIIKKVSRNVYRRCDLIACQSSSFPNYIGEVHGVDDEKMCYLPAFADDAYLSEDFSSDNGIVDFVFLGNLGISQNLICILDSIKLIKDTPGFCVHFVGDGTCLEEMKEYVKENELENVVKFYGRRPVDEMPDFYKLSDVCMVSLKADNYVGFTLPSKVQGYMAAGKPVLGMIEGSAEDVINESGCGICVKPGDVKGFANAMKEFTERKDFSEYSKKSRDYFMAHFRKDVFMNALETKLKNLVEEKNVNI